MEKKTIFIILIIILISIFIYYNNSLSKSKITSSTVKTPTGLVIQEQEEVEEMIPEETIEKTTTVIEETESEFPETFLTEVECIDGKEVTFTLNNILKKKIITSELTFYAAGYTIRNPICDETELNPEESTNCKLNLRLKLNKIIQFTIAYPAKSQSVNIDCGK